MVLSPNDEEVALSKKKKHIQTKLVEIDTLFLRPNRLKNHTLCCRTHLYNLYKGVPPPPSWDAITIHLCQVFNGTSVLLIITTTVLTNKRHTSQSICTENFDNLFIQTKNWLGSQKFVYNRAQLAAYSFWLAPATMILASFPFLKPCSQMRHASF